VADQPPPQPQPQPPQIPPQPLPTNITLEPVQVSAPDGRRQTMLRWSITTPAGVTVIFGDRAFTQAVAQMLQQHLATWPGELVIPQVDLAAVRRGLAGPNGKGG